LLAGPVEIVSSQGRYDLTMKMHVAAGVPLLLAVLVGCTDAAGETKSGPQVGDHVGVFEPTNVTGPYPAGEKHCLV
jgi:hypothetical protein